MLEGAGHLAGEPAYESNGHEDGEARQRPRAARAPTSSGGVRRTCLLQAHAMSRAILVNPSSQYDGRRRPRNTTAGAICHPDAAAAGSPACFGGEHPRMRALRTQVAHRGCTAAKQGRSPLSTAGRVVCHEGSPLASWVGVLLKRPACPEDYRLKSRNGHE